MCVGIYIVYFYINSFFSFLAQFSLAVSSENGKLSRSYIHKITSTNLGGLQLSTATFAVQRIPISIVYEPNTPFNGWHSIRHLSLSSSMYEQASSKVEETVKKLQEKEREQKERASKETSDKTVSADAAGAGTVATAPPKAVVPSKTLGQKIWAEVVHYYHGFRLLFINMNVARKLLGKVLNGRTLTRREYRLLIRTTGDVFRLVPFSVFVIVPFMELLLPVFIKFFPGMLPSTFETAKDRELKARNNLKVKLEMAKFLQKTLDEMDVQHKEHSSEEAKEFILFFNKVRNSGETATSEEIIKFSKLFEDEITLDSLSRQQLTAICKVLEVGSLGTSNFLRFQLRMKLRSLAADDRMIQREGVDSLNTAELQSACRARGMRAYGLSDDQLKQQLGEWINLSLNEKVPPSLLLLSRAMMLPEDVPTVEKLKASISVLSDAAAIQTKAAIGEREGKIDNRTQIEIIRDEERKIKEELEELKEVEKTSSEKKDELFVDKAKVIADNITNKDIEVVFDALNAASNAKSLIVEKEEIKELKEEIAEYKEDVEELREVARTSESKVNVRESPAAKRLMKKVDAMIGKLDKVMEDLEKEKKLTELSETQTKDDLVRIDEVISAIRKVSNSAPIAAFNIYI